MNEAKLQRGTRSFEGVKGEEPRVIVNEPSLLLIEKKISNKFISKGKSLLLGNTVPST